MATGDRDRFIALYAMIAAALISCAAAFVYEATVIAASQARAQISVDVLETANRVLHDLENLETGQRGYLLTNDEAYLQPYRSGLRDLDDAVLRLHGLVADDETSATIVRRIEHIKNDKVREVSRTLDLARIGNRDEALALVQTGEGKHYMDALRADLGALLDQWREIRRTAVRDVDRRVLLGAATLSVLAVLVCALLIYTLFIQRRAFARVHTYTKHLTRRASTDALTGLPNRRHLLNALALLAEEADEDAAPRRVGLLYLDIDGFKAVNDSLGHRAGDALLRALARGLREETRQRDVLTRVGGDEFVLLVADYGDHTQLRELALRLADRVRDVRTSELGERFQIGVSIGIATYPDTASSIEGLLDAADAAMYEAKRAGTSSYVFARKESEANVIRFHRP
ncbi:diguanylate cyclase [Caballeronia zhejiangensis]|uniref:diguanylate cyclase n=1 Tax=Caballeronia zhejiangensis TaxID=871203 RepID=UPI001EF4099E|nr:diguanylate cyclase [Caballeronia zhejiangensis]MCG7403032.1 diguanylate cyclase [Caballeronia zhejiangensis]